MNLSLLIDRWELNRNALAPCCLRILDNCISELKMVISGDLRPEHRLDTICHFKKHKGESWKQVIEEDPGYVHWCYENVQGFQLDQIAHAYLIEMSE